SEAARLLGRPYRLHGLVGAGQRRGRLLGFPTANLDPVFTFAPGNGVYAARAFVGDAPWPAALNVGPNPTFGEDARKVEAPRIGFDGGLSGRALAVDFLERPRDPRPFASVTDLKDQLQRDVERARQVAAGEAGRPS